MLRPRHDATMPVDLDLYPYGLPDSLTLEQIGIPPQDSTRPKHPKPLHPKGF
jgi:hypothetical protein